MCGIGHSIIELLVVPSFANSSACSLPQRSVWAAILNNGSKSNFNQLCLQPNRKSQDTDKTLLRQNHSLEQIDLFNFKTYNRFPVSELASVSTVLKILGVQSCLPYYSQVL